MLEMSQIIIIFLIKKNKFSISMKNTSYNCFLFYPFYQIIALADYLYYSQILGEKNGIIQEELFKEPR